MAPQMISVVIPTRNRLNDLLFTLERIQQDHYSSVEVLVGDDASDVDPRPEIARRFPAVRVERNAVRSGPCALRNRLVAAARGEILVSLDDDSHFESSDAFGMIVATFAANPRLGLLSCRLREASGRLWPARRGEPLRETAVFMAGACAIRRSAYEAVGGFNPAVFRAGEERDLAIRLTAAGYDIRHTDDLVAQHRESAAERDHQFIHAHALRNELLFVLQYVPWPFVPWRLLRHAAGHAAFCVRRRWWRALLRGYAGFVWSVPVTLRHRRGVGCETWQRFTTLIRLQRVLECGSTSDLASEERMRGLDCHSSTDSCHCLRPAR